MPFVRGTPLRAFLARHARRSAKSRWGIVVSAVALVLFLSTFSVKSEAPGGSDGHYMWLFARSLVFDHDIDFTNDYAICGDPHHRSHDFGTGHPSNPFYIGPSVTWVPVLWAVKHWMHLPASASERQRVACEGPLVASTLLLGRLLAALAIWFVYRIARRFADDGPAALTAGLFGFTSSLPAYAGSSYSHVYDMFWASVTMLTALRASERPQATTRWALAGASVGIGLLQRPASVLYGVIPAALVCTALRGRWRQLGVALAALGVGAFLFGLLPQMLEYRYLYGSPFGGVTARSESMQYGHSHPLLVLFGPHGGLFYTMPAAWVAVCGFALGAREPSDRPLMLAIAATCAVVTWLSGSIGDWTGSGTFGARRLTSLLPLLAPPTAIALAAASRWLRDRPDRAMTLLGVALLIPAAFTILGATRAMGKGTIPSDVGSSQADLYGEGEKEAWRVLDENVGDLAVLPAEFVFQLRYGLKRNAFRDASEDIKPGEINLTTGQHANLVTGLESTPEGMRFAGARATIVFGIQWPYASTVVVRGRSAAPTRLRAGLGGWLGTKWWGELALDASGHEASLAIPPGAFDSGIVEIVLERVSPGEPIVLSGVEVAPVYPPAP